MQIQMHMQTPLHKPDSSNMRDPCVAPSHVRCRLHVIPCEYSSRNCASSKSSSAKAARLRSVGDEPLLLLPLWSSRRA